ncbi:MAG: hypothetical protein ABI068_11045 [Ktedonobacterales bacterium]
MSMVRSRKSIQQHINEFERENPKIAQAMDLFDMTMTQYQAALNALRIPNLTTSSSTVRLDASGYGYWMGRYS